MQTEPDSILIAPGLQGQKDCRQRLNSFSNNLYLIGKKRSNTRKDQQYHRDRYQTYCRRSMRKKLTLVWYI